MRLGAQPALALGLAAALAAPGALPARAGELLRCLDARGAVHFTNASCPEGFALDARWPARDPSDAPPPPAAAPGEAAPSAEAPDGGAVPAPPEAPERVEESCAAGSFETRDRIGGFEVRFTNRSSRACRGVSYYCLWGVVSSAGFYRQSAEGRHEGLVRPGETVALGTIRARGGPADREVVWSWCVPRTPGPAR